MTVIAGMVEQDGGTVVLAADSQSSSGGVKQTVRTSKLVALCDRRVVVGFTGSWRYGEILRFHVAPRLTASDLDRDDEYEWGVTKFIPALRAALADNGAMESSNGADQAFDEASGLIAIQSRLFFLGATFHITEPEAQWDAAGAGHEIAAGAMLALRHHESPETCVVRVVEAACDYHQGCGLPVRSMRTRA